MRWDCVCHDKTLFSFPPNEPIINFDNIYVSYNGMTLSTLGINSQDFVLHQRPLFFLINVRLYRSSQLNFGWLPVCLDSNVSTLGQILSETPTTLITTQLALFRKKCAQFHNVWFSQCLFLLLVQIKGFIPMKLSFSLILLRQQTLIYICRIV